jgi:ribonucleoside-triphosphate reductase
MAEPTIQQKGHRWVDDLQYYIFISKYARWIPEENRRETWDETVTRYVNFWKDRYALDNNSKDFNRVFDLMGKDIYDMKVMPSMRALMVAGEALKLDEIAAYNSTMQVIMHIRCFDELFYLALCSCGTGFSVERVYIEHSQLPEVSEDFDESDTVIKVKDSKIGWCRATKELIAMLYSGQIP